MWIAVQDFSEARWNIAHTLRIRANCRQTRMVGRKHADFRSVFTRFSFAVPPVNVLCTSAASEVEPFPRNGSRYDERRDGRARASIAHKRGRSLMNAESWYAIWTRSHCERLVEQQLYGARLLAIPPRGPGRSKNWRTPRGTTSRPRQCFPGLLIRDAVTGRRYVEMLRVRGIVRVLEDGWTRLTPVPESDIDAIRHIVESGVAVFQHPLLRHGERVRVVDGPLSGIEGIFVTDSQQKGRLVAGYRPARTQRGARGHGEDVVQCD